MIKLATKNIILLLNAVMNILGAMALPSIGVGMITMLVIWNALMVFMFTDEHYRIKRKIARLNDIVNGYTHHITKEKEETKGVQK